MAGISVRIDAASKQRGLVPTGGIRSLRHEAALSLWVRMIDQAVQDAKRTHCGRPTDVAIMSRWWIVVNRPLKTDKDAWETSFERACTMLDLDVDAWRKKLGDEIEQAWLEARERTARSEIYLRQAMVLACAGIPVAIARQYVMPLVSAADYDVVAGVDHGDQYIMYDRVERGVVHGIEACAA